MPALDRQLTSLTGLRFFAALTVILYHLRIYFAPIGDSLAMFDYGFTAVSFFFILSGFVLCWSQRNEVMTRKFYFHRAARIWPLHLMTMFLAIWVPALPTSTGASWISAPFVATLTQAWIPASPLLNAFNGVSWSLSCEAFFYLIFPLLFKKLERVAANYLIFIAVPVISVVLVAVLAAVTSMPTADFLLGTMPLFRAGEFILGMCLAKIMKAGWRPKFSVLQALGLLALLTAGLLAASWLPKNLAGHLPVTLANVIMVPGFLAVLAACAKEDIAGRTSPLNSSILVRLGQWSFALYLIHEVVLRVFRPWTEDRSAMEVCGLAALVVVISVAAAGALHELVEKPLERQLRSWAATIGGSDRYSTRGHG